MIDVVSTLPNRYASFSAEAPKFENKGRLKIYRIALPSHKSGMADQVKSFINYYISAIKLSKKNDYDLVFATSSRLFTAFLGRRISFIFSPILKMIENYTFRKADKINLVSEGFASYFGKYPDITYDFFTNGIDREFVTVQTNVGVVSNQNATDKSANNVKTLVYAGNVGEGQGLHRIIPQLAAKLGTGFVLQVIGDGGRKEALIKAVESAKISNVQLSPPVPRSELIDYYHNADILFLHLNDYEAFKKVLPSKIFEYAALNKPILAGVSGFAAQFIEGYVDNAVVFYPCDAADAAKSIERLAHQCEFRTEFIKKYLRDNIMSNMSRSILSLIKNC